MSKGRAPQSTSPDAITPPKGGFSARLRHGNKDVPPAATHGPHGTGPRGADPGHREAELKIRRKGTGTAQWRNGHWWVLVSLPDGTRPRYRLCGDECDCLSLSDARRLDGCEAISQRQRAKVSGQIADDKKADREKRLTVAQLGQAWTEGKLYERHGDVKGLRLKKSAGTDASRLKAYVYSEIGNMSVADVTEQDIERVLRAAEKKARKKLGRAWRKASRFQVYQAMRRLFDLAIRPGRAGWTDNPVAEYMRPGRDDPKLFGYLYPSEFLALLNCTTVSLDRRVLYALAIYTGLRKGSLYAR